MSLPVDVPSPCVKVCTMDPGRGVCLGCYRTLDEIGGWSVFSAGQKRAVLARIEARIRHWGPPAMPARGIEEGEE